MLLVIIICILSLDKIVYIFFMRNFFVFGHKTWIFEPVVIFFKSNKSFLDYNFQYDFFLTRSGYYEQSSYLANQSISQAVNQPISYSVNQSHSQSANQSIRQSVNQSISILAYNQLVNQSVSFYEQSSYLANQSKKAIFFFGKYCFRTSEIFLKVWTKMSYFIK